MIMFLAEKGILLSTSSTNRPKPMKYLSSFLLIAILFQSCVDKDFNLSKVDTDNVTIGGETSSFRIPLANISISMSEIGSNDMDLSAIFDEADTWLPSTLPGNSAYLDMQALQPGAAYTDDLLSALIVQMHNDDAKLTKVSDLIWSKYSADFLPILNLPENIGEAQFKASFKTAFRTDDAIVDVTRQKARNFLIDISVDPLNYSVDRIDIGSEVVDMLSNNLDPRSTPENQRKNTLHIYGAVDSDMPLSMTISPSFSNTDVVFSSGIGPDENGQIAETQLFENDLRTIIGGTHLVIPITLLRYYPGGGFSDDQQITINLRMHKRGGLKLDI